MLQIQPVDKIKSPGYPNKSEISRDRSILLARPERWRGKAMAATLAALVPLTAAGCSAEPTSATPTPAGKHSTEPAAHAPVKTTVPFFEYGSGFGNVMLTPMFPPNYITEIEAGELFNMIAAEYGLEFISGSEITIDKIKTRLYYETPGTKMVNTVPGKMRIELDGYNEELDLAYEFISIHDVEGMKYSIEPRIGTMDTTYATKDTASLLLDIINNDQSAPNTAIFYDPLSYAEASGEKSEAEGSENTLTNMRLSRTQLLEQQIRDFFEWLKAEGII